MTPKKCYLIIFFSFLSVIGFAQEAVSIKIDFGNSLSDLPWNNLQNPSNGTLTNLIDNRGITTEVSISVTDAFNGINNSGTTAADASLELPATASGDSFFGNLIEFSGAIEPTGAVAISNLEVSKEYEVSVFASRLASDNRETEYIIEGLTKDTAYLQVADNQLIKINFPAILPAQDGTINIRCTAGPNNNNANNFYYLGSLELHFMDEPIVIEPELELVYPNGGEYWQSNKTPEIRWKSQGVDSVSLSYSIDSGNNWIEIDKVQAISQNYPWMPPLIDDNEVLLRIEGNSLTDESESVFTITSQDTSECHIVVLGSSTAAGTGPSIQDSAWVWRYEDFIFQNDTRFYVTNLARGGFTTYNILPSNTEIPTGVNQTIDNQRNVTMARALEPDAVIINLPSNDAANRYSVEDQLANYALMMDSLDQDSIVNWVATPQPRNNFSVDQKQIQLDLRDSTFSIFQEFAIDFWNGFENAANDLDPDLDSGDGVHMNDKGHLELFKRVIEKQIPLSLLESKAGTTTSVNSINLESLIDIYPNPFVQELSINWHNEKVRSIKLYNHNSELIMDKNVDLESKIIKLKLDHLVQGIYYLQVNFTDTESIVKAVIKN